MTWDMLLSQRGAVISLTEPWLSASPDGVSSAMLIEVKCPIMNDGETFQEKLKKCDIVTDNSRLVLLQKGRRGFYMQVQLTMFCTGLRKCLFFVWSDKGQAVVEVDYNEEYVMNTVNRLKKFYFISMLPRLADAFKDGRLCLSKAYRDLMSTE